MRFDSHVNPVVDAYELTADDLAPLDGEYPGIEAVVCVDCGQPLGDDEMLLGAFCKECSMLAAERVSDRLRRRYRDERGRAA